MDPFVGAVRRTISRWRMIGVGERLLVAVSGGADSVALLSALLELGHDVVVAHFNHGWRGEESDRDERFVLLLAQRLGATVVVGRGEKIPAAGRRGGLEQDARELRYGFLLQTAPQLGCARIATGHTRDDQAETVLLRLLRGSGATGLQGIRPVRGDGVVRPLIQVGREDVVAYLERRRQDYVEDSSNRDRRFTRNRLRAEVMPLLRQINPRVNERLAGLARVFASAARRERKHERHLLERLVDREGRLDARVLAAEPPATRRIATRAWLRQSRGGLRRITSAHIDAVAACARSGARVELPGRDAVVNEHGTLRFVRGAVAAEPVAASRCLRPGETIAVGARWRLEASEEEEVAPGEVSLPDDLWHAVIDADRAPLPLGVRSWRSGDRIQPMGMTGHRKLSDVFIDAKVPRWRRPLLPVLEIGGRIFWVPGVVRSADAAVAAETTRVIRLRAEILSGD